MDDVKIGQRNNAIDQARIQTIHDLSCELGAECEMETEIDQEGDAEETEKAKKMLMTTGDTVKDLGGGRIGGYLVRFTSPADPDLTGEYFTAQTDFGDATQTPILYGHGYDQTMKRKRIGTGSLKRDDVGIWVEAQLALRDEYERQIYEMAKAGKLGWSSGTAGHLVEKQVTGSATMIKSWPLGLDASLTPTPAEPRNTAQAKSIKPIEDEMNPDEIKSIIDAALAEKQAAADAQTARLAEIKTAEDAGYRKALEELKARGRNAPVYNTQPLGFSEERDAVPAFKHWVQTGQVNEGLIGPDAATKAAFNVTTGASGGYLVPDPLYAQIIAKRNIASWVRMAPTQKFVTASDHLLVPVEDTSHTAFVSTAEGAAYNENEGTVAQVDLALTKYTKLIKASEEFLAGENSNFDAWIVQALARAEAVTENTVATTTILASATAGTAAASATALTIAEVMRLTGSLGAGYNVNGEVGFLMKNATKAYIQGIGMTNYQPWAFGGYPVYVSDDMPAMTAGLRSTLFGNFNFFGVVERPGMLVQRNPYLYMANGYVGIFANIYRGFGVLQAEAFYTMAQA